MHIDCNRGIIDVSYALYARQDYSNCGNQDWYCAADGILEAIKLECDGKASCNVTVNNGIVGDPCGGVPKYLEVTYSCTQRKEITPPDSCRQTT